MQSRRGRDSEETTFIRSSSRHSLSSGYEKSAFSRSSLALSVLLSAPTPHVFTRYVPNVNGNDITHCSLDGTGSITSCVVPATPAGGWTLNNPRGIVIANGVAYVTNWVGSTISQCTIDPGTNVVTSCAIPSISWAALSNPWGISILNNVAYVNTTPGGQYEVAQCTIDPGTKSITACVLPSISGSWNLNYPTSVFVI